MVGKNKMVDVSKFYNRLQGVISTKIEQGASLGIEEVSKDVLIETIEEVVYEGEFQPYSYERRGVDGGYKDRENLKTSISSTENGVVYSTTNETTGTGDAYGQKIDEIIETGKGYTWKRQPPARPVFATAKQKINERKNDIIFEIKRALDK